MPAPRPTSRISPQEAQKLIEAASDLGFSRSHLTSAQTRDEEDFVVTEVAQTALEASVKSKAPKKETGAPADLRLGSYQDIKARKKARIDARTSQGTPKVKLESPSLGQAVRLDVPDEVWTALKLSAIKRRTTVKYLILEALKKADYPVNLDLIPEDGRRLR